MAKTFMHHGITWKHKAALQRIFSLLPRGEQLNYVFQRWVTRSLPGGEAELVKAIGNAKEHVDVIQQHRPGRLGDAVFYEFGAGWTLWGPLTLWSFGVERQIVVDKRRLFHPELVNDGIGKFQRVSDKLALLRRPSRRIDQGRNAVSSLRKHYGIEYRAPCDARNTGLKDSSVDFITSTSTLEHIPSLEIKAILRECRRLLKRDGLMTCSINYDDHYSFFDNSISCYNFLCYSDESWVPLSPGLHFQNRLRHPDYLRLLRDEGFTLIEDCPEPGTPADLEALRYIPLAECFKEYSPEQLAVHRSLLLVRSAS